MFAFAARKIWRLYPLHLIMLFWGALYLVLQHKSLLRIAKGLLVTIPLLQTWVPAADLSRAMERYRTVLPFALEPLDILCLKQ